jgi:hypothetical protein
MRSVKRLLGIGVIAATFTLLSVVSVKAGDVVLSNNSGSSSTVWFISGEASLIMNGFDLAAAGVSRPARIDRVSINLASAVPGQAVDVVIYQDANGGSPVDATVAGQTQANISTSGVFTVDFPTPVEVTQPVVWVGFYLPVDFEFYADTSGSSVLTYWAWQPGARFDLTNLSSAGVLGPSDGSAPVNIDMGGVARISVEFITDGSGTSTTTTTMSGVSVSAPNGPQIRQVVGPSNVSLAPMVQYPLCQTVSYDRDDVNISYRSGVRWFCQLVPNQYSPPTPEGYLRLGLLYDVYVFGIESGATRLPIPVTHCIAPPSADLNTAVLGLASGAPRRWQILPTVRFGNLICAELFYAGNISYFVPSN